MRKLVLVSFFLFLIVIVWWTTPKLDSDGTIKIWDRNNILLYESAGEIGKSMPVEYDDLPENLIEAIIASEDNTFWKNPGFDLKAIIRSTYLNFSEGRIVSGASTITQQLARSAIISPNRIPKKSIIRKIREILIAARLATTFSKKEIITMYCNRMYFGNLSYGVQAASLTYFDKDVNNLSLAESSFLVGLLSSPENRNPFTNLEEGKKKQAQVLEQMLKEGFISDAEAEAAKLEELSIKKPTSSIRAPHFVQHVLQQVDEMEISDHSGLNVYTTLDFPTFSSSENITRMWVDDLRQEHDLSNAALIMIKNDTGEIINMLGGVDYFDATASGQVNMTTAQRQPGSALKPVTYAAAFMSGYTPATLIYDVRKVFKTKTGEGFTPNNYDGRYHGLVLAREALASSLNLPAVEMLERVGIDSFLSLAKNMGITTFTQDDRYDLSITLGGGEVTLLELSNIYATFGRNGEYLETYAIEKITDDADKKLYEHKRKAAIQVLGENSAEIAYLISDILSDPKARIPGFKEKNPLVLSHPAAVKTGTTTDWHDNWTIGYTPNYAVGVWVGNNDNHPMREITGVVGAAPIWNQFFEEFLKGKPTEQFARPEKIVETEICTESGKLVDGLCSERKKEIFLSGTEPTEISNLHKVIQIDTRNGLLGGANCSDVSAIADQIFIDYPPEVYSWAVENDLPIIPKEASEYCKGEVDSNNDSYLKIVYPKEKTIFESAPLQVSDENAVFEVNVSSQVDQVVWFVDGEQYSSTTKFPFESRWKLIPGQHRLYAKGFHKGNIVAQSEDISFSVVEYKEDIPH